MAILVVNAYVFIILGSSHAWIVDPLLTISLLTWVPQPSQNTEYCQA